MLGESINSCDVLASLWSLSLDVKLLFAVAKYEANGKEKEREGEERKGTALHVLGLQEDAYFIYSIMEKNGRVRKGDGGERFSIGEIWVSVERCQKTGSI